MKVYSFFQENMFVKMMLFAHNNTFTLPNMFLCCER